MTEQGDKGRQTRGKAAWNAVRCFRIHLFAGNTQKKFQFGQSDHSVEWSAVQAPLHQDLIISSTDSLMIYWRNLTDLLPLPRKSTFDCLSPEDLLILNLEHCLKTSMQQQQDNCRSSYDAWHVTDSFSRGYFWEIKLSASTFLCSIQLASLRDFNAALRKTSLQCGGIVCNPVRYPLECLFLALCWSSSYILFGI